MSDPGPASEVGDVEKRHHVEALVVASLSTADVEGGSGHPPFGMLVSVDPDEVPGLGEILDRHEAGENFDIVSRWAIDIDESGEHPSRAVVDFYLPEVELGVSIFIDVDKASEAIQTAIQTQRIFVVDPARCKRLQEADEIGTELGKVAPLTVTPPDPTPAIGVLQQHFDYPRKAYRLEKVELPPEARKAAYDAFVEGARPVEKAGVMVRGDGPAVIVLLDPASGSIKSEIGESAEILGRWGVMAGDDHSLALFDVVADGEHVGRWVIPDLPPDIVRAGSNGAHWVIVVSEFDFDGGSSDGRIEAGIHSWVPHVEALRTLRFKDSPPAQ